MKPLRILSLGAGVQSSTLALMATTGDIPPFDHAIFSDTQWEPRPVYEHFARLKAELVAAGIQVHEVTAGNLREDHVNPQHEHLFIRKPRKHPEYLGKQRTFIPVYITTPEETGARYLGDEEEDERYGAERIVADFLVASRKGMTRRTCTKTYKIEPVERKIRDILGLKPRQRWPLHHAVDQIMGISWDESERMTKSLRPAIVLRYPLIDMRMTRDDCHRWLDDHGWPDVPRSACIGCPFHDDDEWRSMRDERPDEWEDAVEFDRVFRDRQQRDLLPMIGTPYLHAQRVPLDEVDLDRPTDDQLSLFGEECAGYCGT